MLVYKCKSISSLSNLGLHDLLNTSTHHLNLLHHITQACKQYSLKFWTQLYAIIYSNRFGSLSQSEALEPSMKKYAKCLSSCNGNRHRVIRYKASKNG